MTAEISIYHNILTRVLLIGSFLIFAAGASIPAADGFWGLSFEEGLDWVASNPGRWSLTNILFIVSFLSCLSGLAFFNQHIQEGTARSIAITGFGFFLIGAVFWFIDLSFRLGFEPWAARLLKDTAEYNEIVSGLHRLQTTFFNLFMEITFLGSAVYGVVLVHSPSFSSAAGWFAIAYSLLLGLWFLATGGPIPIMVLVVPLILGLIGYPV